MSTPPPPRLVTPDDDALTGRIAKNEQLRHLRKRVRQLERTVRAFLWSETLTKPQRDELMALVTGITDPQPRLTPVEAKFVERFRALTRQQQRVANLVLAEFAKKGGR